MTLKELNEEYYLLFNDLDEASPSLPEKQYDIMAKVLQQRYLEDLDICLTERMLLVGNENFELKFKARYYLPRRVWLRWNKMAKALLSDYKAAFEEFLTNLKSGKKKQHEPTENVQEVEPPKVPETTALTVAKENAVAAAKEPDDDANG